MTRQSGFDTSRLLVLMVLILMTVLALMLPASGLAEPYLVRNINVNDIGASSGPRFDLVANGVVFVAQDGSGVDIWQTNGTPGGTSRLAENVFDETNSVGSVVLASGDGLAFYGHRTEPGVWQSDGTVDGTIRLPIDGVVETLTYLPGYLRLLLVVDVGDGEYRWLGYDPFYEILETLSIFRSTAPDGIRFAFSRAGGRALLHVSEGSDGQEALWSSIGTAMNPGDTERIASGDFVIPLSDGDPGIYFTRTEGPATNDFGGRVLGIDAWFTDGTRAGTRRLGAVAPDAEFVSIPGRVVPVGDRVLFMVTVDRQRELWAASLGTDSPERLAIVDPERNFFYVNNSLRSVGDRAVFAAFTEAEGVEPWFSDGTVAGTRMVADLCPGACSSRTTLGRNVFARLDGRIAFAGTDGEAIGVWEIDEAGTISRRVNEVCATCSEPRGIALASLGPDRLLISSRHGLFLDDGATPEVERLGNVRIGLQSVRFDDRLVFQGSDLRGTEPWSTNGTAVGTTILADIRRDDAGSLPSDPIRFDGAVVFEAAGERRVRRTWRSDGTEAGSVPLGTLDEDDPWRAVADKRIFGEHLILQSTTSGGTAFWSTASLDAPPVRLTDFAITSPFFPPFPGEPPRISLRNVAETPDALLFCVNHALWRSDGTPEGSTEVGLAEDWQSCGGFHSVGDLAMFTVNDEDSRAVLWASDGTAAGSRAIRTPSGAALDEVNGALVVGDLLFVTRVVAAGTEVWSVSSDRDARRLEAAVPQPVAIAGQAGGRALFVVGSSDVEGLFALSPEGTVELLVPSTGLARSRVSLIDRVEDDASSALRYVRQASGVQERIWVTDGTVAGSRIVLEGPFISGVSAQFGDRFVYRGVQGLNAVDAAGRQVLLATDFERVELRDGRVIDGVLVFHARRSDGREDLWRTDLSPVGTFAFTDGAPGLTRHEVLLPVGDVLLFSAYRSDIGTEPWAVPREALAPRLALRGDDRWRIRVRWTKPNGETGFGVPNRLTTDTGAFYFFRESNVELMIKVLDGRTVNGHFWVFYGALSNLEYEITVTDGMTGDVKVYRNPLDTFGSVGDTLAFRAPAEPAPSQPAPSQPAPRLAPSTFGDLTARLVPGSPSGKMTPCVTTRDALCLRQSRFRIEVEWEKPDGDTGTGTAVQLTPDTGYFTFFRDSNIELMIKVLDGRTLNGHFWLFYGALSNLRYRITVTDTETGRVKIYENPAGNFGSVGDTRAFTNR